MTKSYRIKYIIFSWFILIAQTILAQEIDLNRGLVSYYPFDEDARDAVGNNHGIIHGAIHDKEGRCGDMAYNFDGYLDYIECGNDRSLNGNWNGLTISVWVRPGVIPELQLATILAKWAFNPSKDHFGLWLNSSYRIVAAVSAPGTMENGVFSKSTLSYDQWHHIVFTWRRNAREIRIYIDGELDNIGRQTGRNINVRSPIPLRFGRQINGSSRPFKGWIDEVRIYKRALYEPEVRALYDLDRIACKKVIVEGHVLNKDTREPVQAVVVFQNMHDGSIYKRIKTTGPEAYYEVVLPLGNKYAFYAETENYLAENQNISTVNRSPNDIVERDLYVIPVEVGQSMRLNNIFFDFAKATLREESSLELDRILPYFEKFPNLKIEISGHTDWVGSDEANIKLSNARANAVRNYLVSKGVDPDKIVAIGYGESMPVATNETDEGRQLNRRVEFKVLEK